MSNNQLLLDSNWDMVSFHHISYLMAEHAQNNTRKTKKNTKVAQMTKRAKVVKNRSRFVNARNVFKQNATKRSFHAGFCK